jgi:hypothetical protein
MSRARRELWACPQTISVMGVQMDQIVWLIQQYERTHGHSAQLIDPKAPLEGGA